MFRIDENTGSIFTTRGLDYEKESQHVLIIGTLENMSSKEGSTTKVIVNVEVNLFGLILNDVVLNKLLCFRIVMTFLLCLQ